MTSLRESPLRHRPSSYTCPPEKSLEKEYSPTTRIHRFQQLASREAEKSICVHRLGAIITRGTTVLAKGFNQDRTSFLGKTDCSMHAEMSALNNLINGYARRNPKVHQAFHQLTVWCVRIPWDTETHKRNVLYHSAPCNICLDRLRNYGVGRVMFIDSHGGIRMWKLQATLSKHIETYYTTSQRTFIRHIRI